MTANAKIKEVISNFLGSQERFEVFDDFDAGPLSKKLSLSVGGGSPQFQVADTLHSLARHHFFFQRVAMLKVCRIAQAILIIAEHENPTAHMVLVRTLVEHTATLSFQLRALRKVLPDLSNKSGHESMIQAIFSHDLVVQRLYYGRSPKGTGTEKQYHIEDMLKAFEQDFKGLRTAYDSLCEYVHPNFGSNYLLSSGRLGSGQLGLGPTAYAKEVEEASDCAIRCLDLSQYYAREIAAELVKLQTFIEIASLPKQKPTGIFSTKGLSHEGDGNSKKTAIEFKNARTPAEAVGMIHRLLEERGLSLVGPKHIGGIEEGYIYDVFPTDKGKVWLKTKMRLQ